VFVIILLRLLLFLQFLFCCSAPTSFLSLAHNSPSSSPFFVLVFLYQFFILKSHMSMWTSAARLIASCKNDAYN
jgi:hypothetical protein